MFEKVGSPDTVPLEDNRFVVDGSVNEVTVVLFSKPDSPPAVLLSPSGGSYKDSDLPAGIAWSRDQGYDMITIASPQKGEWVLQADVDPDNRVMIVTDLKLQTSEVPTHIAAGEQTRVEASLSNRGKLVARQAFLRLVDVRAEASGAGDARSLPLNDLGEAGDEKAGDGRYTMRFGEQQAGQEVELVVAVDSPTFMREKRFRLVVHEPVAVAVAESPDGPVLRADVQPAVMQPGAIVTAWQEDTGGKRVPLQLVQPEPGQWTVPLKDLVSSSYVNVSGTTRLGNLIEHTVGPLMLSGVELPPPVAEAPPVIEPVPEPVAPVAEAVAEVPAEPEVEEGGWLIPAIIFGVLNLTLLIGAGVWFFLMNRRGAESDELDLEQLIETQVSAPNAEESQPRENAA
jgi:uncharacterized protein (TIGR03503 family)